MRIVCFAEGFGGKLIRTVAFFFFVAAAAGGGASAMSVTTSTYLSAVYLSN